ncbi:hypothetical protein EVB53_119 [Rhizobium phage RHph_Y60]|nr:hypothetical protein EVB53_119 [Rhizobium phage RHph_Y60]
MAKTQRDEERVRPQDVRKIHELHRKYHVETCLIAERFGVDENAIKDILSRPYVPPDKKWRVRWDDEEGKRREELFESFRGASMFNKRLCAEWSRVEPT